MMNQNSQKYSEEDKKDIKDILQSIKYSWEIGDIVLEEDNNGS